MNISLHKTKKKWNLMIFTVLVFSFSGVFAGGTIKGITEIEDTEFEVGEQFMVKYILRSNGQQLNGSYRISGDNFGALDFLGKEDGSSFSNFNGSISHDFILTYYFQSKKPGVFKVPGIKFLFNGKEYPCQAKTIKIIKQKKDSRIRGDLTLLLKPNKTSVYVGEPVVVDLQWYSAFNTKGFQLKELPKFDGFIVKSIPSKTPNKIITINGKKYLTNKYCTFILTPIKPGKIKLPKVKGDMHLRIGFFPQTEAKPISSDKITLTIKPLPSGPNGAPKNFDGLVGEYKLSQKTDKKVIVTNDALTSTITIKGSGNLASMQNISLKYPLTFEALPPTNTEKISSTTSGYSGSKTFEFIAIPRQPGKFEIPAIEIPFFNTKTESYDVLKSEPIQINVTGKGVSELSNNPNLLNKEKATIKGSDIRYLKTNTSILSNGKKFYYTGSVLYYLLSGIGIVCFLIGGLIFRERKYSIDELKNKTKSKANRIASKKLQAVEKLLKTDSPDFHVGLDVAMSNYLKGKLMLDEEQMDKQTIKKILIEKNISETLVEQTIKISEQCKMARFSPLSISKKDLFTEAKTVINQLENLLK